MKSSTGVIWYYEVFEVKRDLACDEMDFKFKILFNKVNRKVFTEDIDQVGQALFSHRLLHNQKSFYNQRGCPLWTIKNNAGFGHFLH